MQVPKENIEAILDPYKPEYKYLKEAKLESYFASGVFNLNNKQKKSGIISPGELELSMKQLALAAFSVWLPKGQFHNPVKIKEYAKNVNGLRGLHQLIEVGGDIGKFHDGIDLTNISGEMILNDQPKVYGKLYGYSFSCKIENRKVGRQIEVVYRI